MFKNVEKINSLNSTDPSLANDIGFDEKSKQEIQNLYPKVGSTKEAVERYTTQQLQSITEVSMNTGNKLILKIKNQNGLICYDPDLKGEP